MVLQMDFVVARENAEAFEKMYYSVYVPAMTVQQGYLGSKLLRFSGKTFLKKYRLSLPPIIIKFKFLLILRKTVGSGWQVSQHQIAWPSATALAKEYKWRGYDVMGDDDQQ